ncbi:NACHT nucleoside triphosphatase [Penicillium freii]|nr:NACHT nucleoside triphosphatase [Penicillium freii]
MASTISYDGPNSGFQVGQNHGHITAQFLQSETSLNQACLRDLRTTNPHDDKDRIKNTNGGLLKDSYCWILDNEQFKQWQASQSNRLLWIRGDPGKGKRMLLCGIIEELTRSTGNTANISFFFCQATDARVNTATAVLRGLVYSLVEKQPSLLSHVRSRYDQAGKVLFEDINAWNALSMIFTDILKDPTLQDTYLMIDALDECTPYLPFLLGLIAQESSVYPHVKWIVSSRNWADIEECLGTAAQTALISLELNQASVSEAVNKFIQHKVQHLATVKKYKDESRDAICRHLSSNSQGTFLWVALVCQDLNRTSRRHALKKLETFPPGLNALYGRMIDQVRNSEDAELCKRILAVMSTVYRPITFDELSSFIELPYDLSDDYEALSEIIAICGSFLTLRKTLLFSSIEVEKDWSSCLQTLEGHSGSVNSIAWSPNGSRLASASKDNTIRIWDPATGQCASTLEGHSESVDSIAWSQDRSRLASASKDNTVRIWDPATGQCASTLEGHSESVDSIAWSQDGGRLASTSRDSTVRIWDPATGQCVLTLQGHSNWVRSIAWSQDGGRLASASRDSTVRIWDPSTGQCASTLYIDSPYFIQFDKVNPNNLLTRTGTSV